MFCINCQRVVRPHWRYCLACGRPVLSPIQWNVGDEEHQERLNNPEKAKREVMGFWVIASSVVVLFVTFILVMTLLS